jgi:hypothetical protein
MKALKAKKMKVQAAMKAMKVNRDPIMLCLRCGEPQQLAFSRNLRCYMMVDYYCLNCGGRAWFFED